MFEPVVTGFGVEASAFLARKSIEITADAFDGLRDCLGCSSGCALEQHVLDKMRNAIYLGGFVPAANPHPDAQTDAGHVRNFRRGDS